MFTLLLVNKGFDQQKDIKSLFGVVLKSTI